MKPMSEPCKQEGTIGALVATVEGVEKNLERFVVVLERIAAQGEKISHVEKDQNEIFARLRIVELNAEGERTRIAGMVAAIAIIFSCVTAWIFKKLGG